MPAGHVASEFSQFALISRELARAYELSRTSRLCYRRAWRQPWVSLPGGSTGSASKDVLAAAGILRSQRGRAGGFTLGRPSHEIRLGDALRLTEPDFDMVECFARSNACALTPFCRLPAIVADALDAFMAVMDRHTLADLILRPQDFGVIAAARTAASTERSSL